MLVLTRKKSEKIILDGQITITVVKVKGNSVRIGIEAPRHVPIRRGELDPELQIGPQTFDFGKAIG